jgi:hypothetical protein
MTSAERPQWPTAFRRGLLVLVVVLSLATASVSALALWRLHQVDATGVHTQATALGPAVGSNGAEVYVRFLHGNEALIATAEAPLWSPDHGSRVKVAFLPADPLGTVAIVDSRNRAGYLVPAGAIVVAVGCVLVAAAALRRERSATLGTTERTS